MMARAAVRDAGRVLDIPYGTVDRIAKLIPEGPKVYLDDCLKPNAELKQAYDADEIVRQIVDLARPLEGLVRQDSIHAAGVVIGDRLRTTCRSSRRGPTRSSSRSSPMGDVEALGLLKMDFLGLRNLDVLDKAVDLVGGLVLTRFRSTTRRRTRCSRAATRRASSSSSRRGCARRSARCGRPSSRT